MRVSCVCVFVGMLATPRPSSFSTLPYDVSNDKALEHEAVRKRMLENMENLRSITERVQKLMMDSLHKIP